MKQHCVVIHTYIYQIGPSKFRLLARRLLNLYLLDDNTSVTNQESIVLSHTTANFISQLFHIVINYLHLKAPI